MDASILDLIRAAAPKGAVPPGADLSSQSVTLPFAALLSGAVPPDSGGMPQREPATSAPPAQASLPEIAVPTLKPIVAPVDGESEAAVVEGPAQKTEVVIAVPAIELTGLNEDAPEHAPATAVRPAGPESGAPIPNPISAPLDVSASILPTLADPRVNAIGSENRGGPADLPSKQTAAATKPVIAGIPAPSNMAPPANDAAPGPIEAGTRPIVESLTAKPVIDDQIAVVPKTVGHTPISVTETAPPMRPVVATHVEPPTVDPVAEERPTLRPSDAQPKALPEVQATGTKPTPVEDIARPTEVLREGPSAKTGEPSPKAIASTTQPAAAPLVQPVVHADGQQIVSTPAATVQTPLVAMSVDATQQPDLAGRQAAVLPQRTAEQAAIGIQRAVADGRERISLKLNPAELGRIDVRIEIAEDGALRAIVAAEKSETLDLMQRDARGLERALQNAGLKTDSGSLTFDQGNSGRDANENSQTGRDESNRGLSDPEPAAELSTASSPRSAHHGLVDLSV